MQNLIIGVLFSFVLTLVFLPMLIKFARYNGLFVQENYRRIHHTKVSALGGLAIFVSSTISFLLFSDLVDFPDYRMIISSALLLFLIGLSDDLFEMKPIYKFLGQLVSVLIIVVIAGVKIEFIQHYISGGFGVFLDYLASVLIFIAIINAYNMIDGIDMLAAVVGIIILSFLGVWFLIVQQYDFSLALLSISASLFAFMIYNYYPAKIFMGDTGTMTIALIFSVSIVQFDGINSIIESEWQFNNAPAISFALISLLVMDMSRVVIYRIIHNKSPFIGDKSHIHHVLMKFNWSPLRITLLLGLLMVFQLLVSVCMDNYGASTIAIIITNVTIIMLFYVVIFSLLRRRKLE